jgi:hypothetical protein
MLQHVYIGSSTLGTLVLCIAIKCEHCTDVPVSQVPTTTLYLNSVFLLFYLAGDKQDLEEAALVVGHLGRL